MSDSEILESIAHAFEVGFDVILAMGPEGEQDYRRMHADLLRIARELETLRGIVEKLPKWKRLKNGNVPSMAWCLWRRTDDNYVFMGWHDYANCYRIDNPLKPICAVDEVMWAVVPCHEFEIEDDEQATNKSEDNHAK